MGANGNLFVVSSNETDVLELTPTGDLVQYLPLPAGVSGLSGIAFNESGDEAWLSNTSGTVYHLGGFLGDAGLSNISTRLRVETGDKVLIGGFIVSGSAPKTVIVRAIGPSLPLSNKLANPNLELFGASGMIASNDNWQDAPNKQEIIDSSLAPVNDLESAILITLPGDAGYTAIVRGADDESGVGLVKVYDLNQADDTQLANISTRGFVQTGDNVMIVGFILGGATGTATVLIRALGPSLTDAGVSDALPDPTLELHDGNGALLSSNDNWKESQQAEIEATGIPPTKDLESALLETLSPGAYTAIVIGQGGVTGVGLIEVYRLP